MLIEGYSCHARARALLVFDPSIPIFISSAHGRLLGRMIVGMKILLDEPRVFVTYGTATVFSGDDPDESYYEPESFWEGQENGLCGAAVPGLLQLTVGTHTGWIPFRAELHSETPALGETWEEVVEVSFAPTRTYVYLQGLDAEARYSLALPSDMYRARYCIRGFGRASNSGDSVDSYLLQFWPGEPAPDLIIKQSSDEAAYWHRSRKGLAEDAGEFETILQSEEIAATDRERWGDRVPSERLRETEGTYIAVLSQLDLDLEFSLARLSGDTLRQIVAWATLRCLERAGLVGLAALGPVVDALSSGESVPKPFDDPEHLRLIEQQASIPRTRLPAPPNGDYEQSPQDWAVAAVHLSTVIDPLSAALEVLACLAFVSGQAEYRNAFAEVRDAFNIGR